jgi:predicted flap endonuclease-1-like 5' DNA nuclease
MTDGTDNTVLIVIVVAALAALIVAWLVLRSARSARKRPPVLTERSGDERPYVRSSPPPEPVPAAGRGVADEAAAATTDVYGDVLGIDTHAPGGADDLQALKGVGPKLAARLRELGIASYAQLAGLSETEVGMLDERLGPFNGRVARDRLVEQAHYLARGDTDGFEARFGKLGG